METKITEDQGVCIELSGDEVAIAITEFLKANDVRIRGPRTVTVNAELCEQGRVFVDPAGTVDDGRILHRPALSKTLAPFLRWEQRNTHWVVIQPGADKPLLYATDSKEAWHEQKLLHPAEDGGFQRVASCAMPDTVDVLRQMPDGIHWVARRVESMRMPVFTESSVYIGWRPAL